jgi:prepilin-type N-terminal cleavage/methylation domain-containing protein
VVDVLIVPQPLGTVAGSFRPKEWTEETYVVPEVSLRADLHVSTNTGEVVGIRIPDEMLRQSGGHGGESRMWLPLKNPPKEGMNRKMNDLTGPELDRKVSEAIGGLTGYRCANCSLFKLDRYTHDEGAFCSCERPAGGPIPRLSPAPFCPSTDLNAAFAAAEKVGLFKCDTQDGPGTNLRLFQGGGGLWWITNGNRRPVVQFNAPTPALAICEAILMSNSPKGEAPRSAFTLIELLVSISIVTILASMAFYVLHSGRVAARKARTLAVIQTVTPDIVCEFASYRDRRVSLTAADVRATAILYGWVPSGPNDRPSNRWAALASLAARRDMRRMDMPDRWNDVVDPPNIPGLRRTRLSMTYLSAYSSAVARLMAPPSPLSRAEATKIVGQNGSAECLWLIFQEMDSGIRGVRSANQADTDGDGLKEFIDGWGNPIRWLREPVAFTESELHSLPMTTEELRDGRAWSDSSVQLALRRLSREHHDPLDFQMVDIGANPATGWWTLPLIYSAGPDGDYSISTGGPLHHYTASPYVDSSGRFTPIGQPIEPWYCKDNIHNHHITGHQNY